MRSYRNHTVVVLALAVLFSGLAPVASATPTRAGAVKATAVKHKKKRKSTGSKAQRRSHAGVTVERRTIVVQRPLLATLTHPAGAVPATQFQAISDSPSILFASSALAFQGGQGGQAPAGGGGAQGPRPITPPLASPASGGRRARFSDRREGLIAVGIVGGGYIRDLYQAFNNTNGLLADNSGKFLIGGTIQLLPTPRWVIEFDAMRRGIGVTNSGTILGLGFLSNSTGTQWEFPVLVKRRFLLTPHVKPFIGGGLAVRYTNQDSTIASATDARNVTRASEGTTTVGIPLAAGVEFRALIFRFSPELRYTLWSSDKNFSNIHTSAVSANINQLAFILGFTIN